MILKYKISPTFAIGMEIQKNHLNQSKSINDNGLILLWAFAESGIGGILHALKIPFTGIFVGGVAIVCIALMAFYTNDRSTILKALGIVLLVKFAVSPHSPWQAYVAVIFQGYLGYFLFKSNQHFSIKCMLLSVVSMLESAIQRVIIMILIYGNTFMKAIDKAANTIAKSFGLVEVPSLVMSIFGLYIFLHILAGVIIGLWLPSIPKELNSVHFNIENLKPISSSTTRKKGLKAIFTGFFILILILTIIKLVVPTIPIEDIIFIFFRSMLMSTLLIFIIGPLIKTYLLKYFSSKSSHNQLLLKEVISQIPDFTGKAVSLINQINTEYFGIKKFKIYLLGLLHLALTYKK